jgi:exopolysaccharide biosynthesis polyprenyl glycosylphosphotransferase
MASFGAIVIGRLVARGVAGRTAPLERCLVIGEPAQVDRIREKLASSQARANVVASLPLADEDVEGRDRAAIPWVIRNIVAELGVHRIIIAPTTTDSNGVVDLIRIAKGSGVRVSVLPRMFEVVGSAVEFDDVDGLTMLGVRRFGLSRSSRLLKRTLDIVATTIGLLFLAPVISVIALAIWLDSPGSVFFRQIRVGRDGRHFRIFKFRSMVADAEARKDDLHDLNEAVGLFKIAEDPRVTRIGRILRKTSLDELPQLINVLRGEMSLVGPRPLIYSEDKTITGYDRRRLRLTPGMTGHWQIMGSSRVPMHEMVKLDYVYVTTWSLFEDVKILVRTIPYMVARRGM